MFLKLDYLWKDCSTVFVLEDLNRVLSKSYIIYLFPYYTVIYLITPIKKSLFLGNSAVIELDYNLFVRVSNSEHKYEILYLKYKG